MFYTQIRQWDKRPLYIPNFRLIGMLAPPPPPPVSRCMLYSLVYSGLLYVVTVAHMLMFP